MTNSIARSFQYASSRTSSTCLGPTWISGTRSNRNDPPGKVYAIPRLKNRRNKYKKKMEKKFAGVLCFLLFAVFAADAQPRTLNLDEAVQLGIQNSKILKSSQYKIDEAYARLAQAKDLRLPDAKVSFQYLHALMLSRVVSIPGVTKEPDKLPFDFPAYLGTLSVTEPIFNGHQFKYARQSADLLVQLSRMDADKDKEDITWLVIDSYITYDKILENQLIVAQNMQ